MISRNGFDTTNMMTSEVVTVDIMYEIADAEFNSRPDVHSSFASAKGMKSWARYYLKHEIFKIAIREGLFLSDFSAMKVAERIASDWFAGRDADASVH